MAPVKTQIVSIGNSRGVRIPKVLLDQADLGTEVVIELRPEGLMIRSAARPRTGWEKAFRAMAAAGDDRLLDGGVATAFDEAEWTW